MTSTNTPSSHTGTLAAGVADSVKFTAAWGAVKIINQGPSTLYFRCDGSTAAVAATGTTALLPLTTTYFIQHFDNGGSNALVYVSLISGGTPTYTVAGVNLADLGINDLGSDISFSADEWDPLTSYAAGTFVIYRGNLYYAHTGHISGATFNSAYWTRYTSGGEQLSGIESFGAAGHSYVDYGSTDEGGSGRPYFFGRLAAALGVPYGRTLNCAASGTSARWGGWRVFQEFDPGASVWPYSPRIGVGLVWHAGNDAYYGAASDGWVEHSFKCGMVSQILRWRHARTYYYDNATCSYSGTWVAVPFTDSHPSIKPGQGTGTKRTSTAGSKVTITTPTDLGRGASGQWVDLLFKCGDSGATGTVYLDGVLHGSLDTGMGAAAGTAFSHGYGDIPGAETIYTYRLYVPTTYQSTSSLVTDSHEIEIRFGASVSSGSLHFNGWAIEATTPPPVLVPDVVQIAASATGLSGSMSDTSIAATYSTWIDELAASILLTEGGSADPAVIVCDVNDALGGTLGTWTAGDGTALGSNKNYFLTDGVHLNHEGAAIAVDVCIDALTEALQLNLDRKNTAGSYAFAELDPLTEPPYVHRSAGQPVSVLDDFEREPSEYTAGGSGTETNGAWGVDSLGQLFCVDPLFPHYEFRDDFTRTSTTTLGQVEWDANGDTRAATAQNGTWGTSGSRAYVVTKAGSGHNIATWELGSAATQSIEAQLSTSGVSQYAGVVLRYVDALNYIRVTGNSFGCQATKVVGGLETPLGTFAGASVGTHLRAEIGTDNVLRCWNSETGFPSTTTFTIADPDLLHSGSGTKVGLWVSSSATPTSTVWAFDEVKAGTTAASTDSRTTTGGVMAGTMIVWTETADGFIGIQQGAYADGSLLDITQGAGIVARKVDSWNYYKLVVSYYGYWILYKVVAGTPTQIASWWAGQSPGVIVYLGMSGNRFTLYDADGDAITRYDAAQTYVDDATMTSAVHGVYHPYHDGTVRMRWRDVRWGAAISGRVPRRGDLWLDTTNAPDSVVLYGPYEDDAWGSGTTIGRVAGTFAPFDTAVTIGMLAYRTTGGVGTWIVSTAGTLQSGGTQNEELTWDWVGESGTYTFRLGHLKSTNRGIYTVYVDGTSVGTIDSYGAAAGAISTIAAITVVGDGAHTIRLLAATKNAASSAYYLVPTHMAMIRTGS